MALKFRLKGLAETFVDMATCPECGMLGSDDEVFSTELTQVTFEGIVVVLQCKNCSEIFVPESQRLGIVNSKLLVSAVKKDNSETGEPCYSGFQAVKLNAEKLNAERKGKLH